MDLDTEISAQEIRDTTKKILSDKSADLYNLHPLVLERCSPKSIKVLAMIFNWLLDYRIGMCTMKRIR